LFCVSFGGVADKSERRGIGRGGGEWGEEVEGEGGEGHWLRKSESGSEYLSFFKRGRNEGMNHHYPFFHLH
jgi:hypothetical protein